jgi:uncharacterized protein
MQSTIRPGLFVAAVAIALTGATVANADSWKIMTGPQGGSWYPLGGAI